jgi:hypothetical protein
MNNQDATAISTSHISPVCRGGLTLTMLGLSVKQFSHDDFIASDNPGALFPVRRNSELSWLRMGTLTPVPRVFARLGLRIRNRRAFLF